MANTAPTIIAGNWKMNGVTASLKEVEALKNAVSAAKPDCAVVLCVPATLISMSLEAAAGVISVGGQDCHQLASGAHTGDISAEMLKDLGASHVIVGHSERRADHHEEDAVVASKAEAAFRAGLVPIICVGETENERKFGTALSVVEKQLAGSIPNSAADASFVVAYEPVWAIGTGLTPTTDDIAEMHKSIRDNLERRFGEKGASVPILYGGSMKPGNAAEILAVSEVNGGLVGGASLKADDFLKIIDAV